jgi:hypothetical protein
MLLPTHVMQLPVLQILLLLLPLLRVVAEMNRATV